MSGVWRRANALHCLQTLTRFYTALTAFGEDARMRMKTILLAGGLAVSPSFAAACTLTLNNGGTMGLAMDANTLGSEEVGGSGAALLIASVGSATVQIAAPSLVEVPTGYDDSADSVAVKYVGLGGLSGVFQDYTDQISSFAIGILPLSTLSLDARVVNPNSFAAGNYRLRTVVTCF